MYGIDFGTTYTVISYKKNNKICYLNINNSPLIPTKINQKENLKRLIIEQSNNLDKNLEDELINFFSYLYQRIKQDLNEENEYINCVITVPIRFNDLARNIIKKIAFQAKFCVIKLLGEPIAAAFSILNNDYQNGYYLVYDLGGGTFDATLLNFQDDIYHIEKVDGLPNFGGIDIDLEIAKSKNISMKEAEQIKKTVFLENLDVILKKTYDIILNLANNLEIQALILVGGSSYLKNIEIYLQKYFKIIKHKELQLLVSKGACIYGYDFLERQKFLIDVTPFDLGIEVMDSKMSVIIPRNTPIPVIKKEIFAPVNSKVSIKILQGLSANALECTTIKSLSYITKDPFEISFILDCDGILFVKILNDFIAIDDIFNA